MFVYTNSAPTLELGGQHCYTDSYLLPLRTDHDIANLTQWDPMLCIPGCRRQKVPLLSGLLDLDGNSWRSATAVQYVHSTGH